MTARVRKITKVGREYCGGQQWLFIVIELAFTRNSKFETEFGGLDNGTKAHRENL